MSEEPNSPARFPIWIIGVVIGVVVGGALIFGLSRSSAPMDETLAVPVADGAAPLAPAMTVGPTGAVAPAMIVDDGATIEEWEARIAAATPEKYADLMAQAVKIGDAGVRQQAVQKLLLTWLNADQPGFLDFLDDAEFSESEGSEFWPALVPAAAEVLPSVSEAAAGQPDLDEIVQWMVEYYAEMDPAQAAEWANKWLLDDSKNYALATIAGELATQSLADAETLLAGIESPDARLEAVMNIGATLAQSDSDAALEWARSLPNEEERSSALEEVLWSMSETDPSEAAAQIVASGDPGQLDAVSGSIAEEWAIKEPKKAVDWAETLPAGAAREEAIQGALAGWAENDPKAAFAYYQQNYGTNLETAEWIFDSWAFNDPQTAATEVLKISNPRMRERAVSGVVSGWLDEGSTTEAVERWVDALPPGRERDQASFAIVDMLSFDSPNEAWTRAATIREPEVRSEAIQSAFAGLVDVDPARARTVLNNSNLSPDEIRQLEGQLEGGSIGGPTPGAQTQPPTAPSIPQAP